jgi:hypothetical protein
MATCVSKRGNFLLGLPVVLLSLAALHSSAVPDHRAPAAGDWWAFKTPVKPPVPGGAASGNPIDGFLQARLREKELTFAPPADNRTLLRRLSFDLTGLPPTPEELNQPYEKALDRLLASPRYGERWGRHWLDVVRFGETDGGEHNYERFNAWPYRDYVIDAFNRDLPFNQFVRDQLAGDILHPQDRSKIAATGFLVSGPWDQVSAVLNQDPLMRKTARMDELDDMVTTTAATFLGLTVNCARCHDHKFDPIPTRDYYRFASAFSGAGFGERVIANAEERAKYDALVKPLRSELGKVQDELSEIETAVTARLLRTKYVEFDERQRNSPRRIPVNPIYNREAFPEVKARYWRIAFSGRDAAKARIEQVEFRPSGKKITSWPTGENRAAGKPIYFRVDLGSAETVREIVWASDSVNGDDHLAPSIYQFEASEDGTNWRVVASNLDHISSKELDLPEIPDEELNAALPKDKRDRRAELKTKRDALQTRLSSIPTPARIYAVNPHKPEAVSVLQRGNVATPLEPVTPGGLTCVSQIPTDFSGQAKPGEMGDGERRVALAEWIMDPRNPLTARVIVNRVWYYHFGSGIVNTPSDFGVNGDRPSHPELLDWLATSFMEHGWSLKWLHRQILTSQAYRQSSKFNAAAHQVDAGNRLLWRMPLRRMDAETLRDTVLTVSGNLSLKAGGPSFPLHAKGGRGAFIYHALNNDGPDVWRRSVYRFVVRGGDRVLLDSFDCPDPSVATPQRTISNTPVQALALMNNAFVTRQAGLFSKRLEREHPNDPARQIARAYLLAFGREPSADEIKMGARFIKLRSLALYCRALLNANEFIYTP